MSTLTPAQIAAAARAGGFTGDRTLTIAVAIALAESGGNADATHRNAGGSVDYGLWQINSVHADLLRGGSWANPTDNARMAHSVYANAGNKFTPWTTYKSGRYFAFMSVARSAVSGSGGTLPTGGTASGGANAQPSGLPLPNPLDAVHLFTQLADTLTSGKFWLRVAMFAGGLTLLYLGIKSTDAGKAVTRGVEKAKSAGAQVALAVATDGASVAATKGAKVAAK